MEAVKLDKDKFRLGHTKVFFRAGINGWMEEQRERRIGAVLSWLQAGARGKQGRQNFKKLAERKMAQLTIQRAVRGMVMSKTWPWMTIWWEKNFVGSMLFIRFFFQAGYQADP